MKAQVLIPTLLAATIAFTAAGQNTEGSQPTRGTIRTNAGNSEGGLPPGLEQQEQLPPGLMNRNQLPPGLANRTNESNPTGNPIVTAPPAMAGSNQLGLNTNTPGGGLTPTSGRTNLGSRVFNNQQTQTGTNFTQRDDIVTQADQTLLVQIRQALQPELTSIGAAVGANAAAGTIPVRFIIRNGIVQVLGTVPTIQDKQRILAVVQRVPGVTRVVSLLQVSTQSTTGVNSSVGAGGSLDMSATNFGQAFSTNTLTPTGSSSNVGTSVYFNTNRSISTNLSPTSRTNNPSRALPPGLDKRTNVPGL